jgi:thiol-disulfide isomerase/thioredoxin
MTEKEKSLRLTLYGRSYCHLCDDMLTALAPLKDEFGFEIDWVDVDEKPETEVLYGDLVPVLVHNEQKLCH